MNNEQKESNNYSNNYAAVAVILLLAVTGVYLRGCGSETGNVSGTAATVDRVKESARTAAGNVANAARGNNNAKKAILRADAELERGQAATESIAERINRIEQLVKECIDANRNALSVMQRIEAANTAGKEKSQP